MARRLVVVLEAETVRVRRYGGTSAKIGGKPLSFPIFLVQMRNFIIYFCQTNKGR